MNAILGYIKNYFKEEIKWAYFFIVFSLGITYVFLQYYFKLEETFVSPYRRENSFFLRSFTLYAVPFIGTLFLYSLFYKKLQIWKNYSFVFLLLVTLLTYVIRCKITFYTDLVRLVVSPVNQNFWIGISHQLVHGIILFIIPFIYWWKLEKGNTRFYGWKFKGVSLNPYFIILLLMVPVMAFACTQNDFLKYYPLVDDVLKSYSGTGEKFLPGTIFELSYGFDFLMNEFFFRGFIILAFAGFIGRGIILPMAMFYVFIHFGKPLGETISSFFGGLVLGIIVYETKSIFGGVILHIGVAWMMELAAGIMKF